MKVTRAMAGILMILLLSPVWVLSGESELEPSPKAKMIWMDGIGSGFRKVLFQVGATVGAGFGVEVFGSTLAHDLARASANVGWVFTDVIACNKWYRGNLELLFELFGSGQFKPDNRYFVGLTALLRYNFATVRARAHRGLWNRRSGPDFPASEENFRDVSL